MSDERRTPDTESRTTDQTVSTCSLIPARSPSVELEHCVTCSDEALPAKVLQIDHETLMALVIIEGCAETETDAEVDISLVDDVAPGDLLLVHGGVAIAKL